MKQLTPQEVLEFPEARRHRSFSPVLGFEVYEWLAILVVLTLLLPYWAPLILAFIVACGLQPVIRGIEHRWKGWRGNHAFVVVGLLASAMIGITGYMGFRVARLTVEFASAQTAAGAATAPTGKKPVQEPTAEEPSANASRNGGGSATAGATAEKDEDVARAEKKPTFDIASLKELRKKIMGMASRWVPAYRKDVETFLNTLPKTVVAWLAKQAQQFFSSALEVFFQIGFFFIFLFLFLSKGRALVMNLLRRRPESQARIALWYDLFESASYNSIIAAAAIGFFQATLVAITCKLLGYSEIGLIFLGCFLLSFMPMLGPATVPFVLSVLALLGGDTTTALWLALLCAFAGSIDNVLRSWFATGEEGMNQLVSFVALIGAITLLGFPGLLIGPFLVSLSAMLLGPKAKEGFRPL